MNKNRIEELWFPKCFSYCLFSRSLFILRRLKHFLPNIVLFESLPLHYQIIFFCVLILLMRNLTFAFPFFNFSFFVQTLYVSQQLNVWDLINHTISALTICRSPCTIFFVESYTFLMSFISNAPLMPNFLKHRSQLVV